MARNRLFAQPNSSCTPDSAMRSAGPMLRGVSLLRILSVSLLIVAFGAACASTPAAKDTTADSPANAPAGTQAASATQDAGNASDPSPGASGEADSKGSGADAGGAATAGNDATPSVALQAQIDSLSAEIAADRARMDALATSTERLSARINDLINIVQKLSLSEKLGGGGDANADESSSAGSATTRPASPQPIAPTTATSSPPASSPRASSPPASSPPASPGSSSPSATTSSGAAAVVRSPGSGASTAGPAAAASSGGPTNAGAVGGEKLSAIPGADLIGRVETDSGTDGVLVDLRSNGSTGTGMYLQVVPGSPPGLRLVAQYRYPEDRNPFLLSSVSIGPESIGSVSIGAAAPAPGPAQAGTNPVTATTAGASGSTRFRSGPFVIEQLVFSDLPTISRLLDAALSHSSASLIFHGANGQSSAMVLNPDQTEALSNLLYAYRELGGTLP